MWRLEEPLRGGERRSEPYGGTRDKEWRRGKPTRLNKEERGQIGRRRQRVRQATHV